MECKKKRVVVIGDVCKNEMLNFFVLLQPRSFFLMLCCFSEHQNTFPSCKELQCLWEGTFVIALTYTGSVSTFFPATDSIFYSTQQRQNTSIRNLDLHHVSQGHYLISLLYLQGQQARITSKKCFLGNKTLNALCARRSSAISIWRISARALPVAIPLHSPAKFSHTSENQRYGWTDDPLVGLSLAYFLKCLQNRHSESVPNLWGWGKACSTFGYKKPHSHSGGVVNTPLLKRFTLHKKTTIPLEVV